MIRMENMEQIISSVVPGSIAEEMEIEPGDVLVSVNGQTPEDVFDYRYLINEEKVLVLIRKPDGEEWELEIEKVCEEDLGMEFENGLMDEYRSCRNKCIFCFIDQLPKGMRETLYFKDDDSRLSFLQGNYLTLTNMNDHDLDRIIYYKLSPLNISFQTTNPKLRQKMLRNRFAGQLLDKVRRLKAAGIIMNGQIVLCKGVNDGEELERSIGDLTEFLPELQSVSVVPVGLTRYREGLYPLEPFSKEDAEAVIDCIEGFQKEIYEKHGLHFVHASDEWYLLAERELPEAERYDGYLQLENGVGMLRLLKDEFQEALEKEKKRCAKRKKGSRASAGIPAAGEISVATGKLAFPVIREMAEQVEEICPERKIHVYEIINRFFGEKITVSGLLTGQDIMGQLQGKKLGEKLLLPVNMLRSGTDVFLDDVTVGEVEKTLQVPVDIVKSSGYDLLSRMLGEGGNIQEQ